MSHKGIYAIIQYSPVPERLEFINIGVFLVVPELRYIGIRFSKTIAKIEKVFGHVQKSYVATLKEGFSNRIKYEVMDGWNISKVEKFLKSRSNDIRASNLLPATVEDPDRYLNCLFSSLVGESERTARLPKAATELGRRIASAGLAPFVEHPEPVELPEGLTITAPYAYQNGAYNLIDAIRLGNSQDKALKEAAKKAVEGELLYKHTKGTISPKRLNIVADTTGQSDKFTKYLKDMLKDHHAKLFDMSSIEVLLDDIRQNSHTTSSPII